MARKKKQKKEEPKTQKQEVKKPLTFQECIRNAFCGEIKTYAEKMSEIYKHLKF